MNQIDRTGLDSLPDSYMPLTDRTVPQNRRMLTSWVLLIVTFAVISDQLTKMWALKNLVLGQPQPLIGHLVKLQLVFNSGAAFSVGEQATWIFTGLSTIVVATMIWFSTKIRSPKLAVIFAFLLGGALGNLIDRMFQPPSFGVGHVIDFLNYNDWFVGNVADIWIVCAAVALIVYIMVKNR